MSKQDSKYSRVDRREQEQKNKRPKHPRKKSHVFSKIFWSLVLLLVVAIAGGATLFFSYARSAPALNESNLKNPGATKIYDSSDHKILDLGSQNAEALKQNEVPQQLKDAVISIEDRRFYKHQGVDIKRTIGAAFSNVSHSSSGLQGGSTLDQQLIKLSFFSTKKSDQTLKRKAQEAWLARKLDKTYSKNQILTFYINKVFMGYSSYGMQTAAKFYYGKSVKNLDLAQTALIAGIPNAPSQYNPYSNPKLALARRNEVLDAMLNNKKISQAQHDAAQSQSISDGLLPYHQNEQKNEKAKIADPYIKQVITEVKKKGYDPYASNLKIYTNIDMRIQKRLYNIANGDNYVYFPDNKVQVASTIINPNNGKVVAMLGGRKTGNVTYGLNRAVQTDRTNGSTAKPLMDYAPAFEYLNWATYHSLKDEKYTYPGTNTQLNDFDNQYKGTMTLREALVQSRNVPAIKTLAAVGINKAQNFIGKLGFHYKKQLEYQNGIGLPSSTLQNAAAYSAFANGGTYYKPSYINRIETADGQVNDYSNKGKHVMQSSTAYMITDVLKGVITSPMGSGTRAQIPGLYQAGKTGTNAYPDDIADKFPDDVSMDSWFNGYTKNYSVSVWTGYDHPYQDNNYLDTASERISQLVYKAIMSYISQGKTNSDWSRPSNVLTKEVNGVRELYLAGSPDQDIVKEDSEDSSSSSKSTSSEESSSSSSSSSSEQSSSNSSEESSSSSEEQSSSSEGSESSSQTPSSSTSTQSSSQPSSSETQNVSPQGQQ